MLVISAFRRMLLLFDLGLFHIRIALCKLRLVLPYQLANITQDGYDLLQVLLKSFVLVLVQCCDLHAAKAKQRFNASIDINVLQRDYLPQKVLNLKSLELRSSLIAF